MPDENEFAQTEVPTHLAPAGDADVPADAAGPVVDTAEAAQEHAGATPFTSATGPQRATRGGVPVWTLLLAAVIPAAIVGAAVWFFAPSNGGESRLRADASNLLGAFTSGGGGTSTTRYEGALPTGYPDDIPAYDGAKVVAGLSQVTDPDVQYIVMQDTGDSRDAVAAALKKQFDADPWQIDLGQDARDLTLYQFSRIDDPDITGVVLISASEEGGRTTIITSIEQLSGAAGRAAEGFELAAGRPTPEGFPNEVLPYEGSVVIDAAYQKDGGSLAFAVSYITKDSSRNVLRHYQNKLEDAGLTVEDGDPTTSALEAAEAIRFSDDELQLTGEITVGTFAEDDSYTRIDVQVRDER